MYIIGCAIDKNKTNFLSSFFRRSPILGPLTSATRESRILEALEECRTLETGWHRDAEVGKNWSRIRIFDVEPDSLDFTVFF